MRQRWLPVGLLAGVLFALNILARLIVRWGFDNDTKASDRISLGMFAAIGLILAVVAFVWGRRVPLGRWTADLGAAVLVAMLLTIFIGPFLSGSHPFADGAGEFFSQIWLYAGCTAVGATLGYLVLTALGLDHRSQSLQRYAEAKRSKPPRVVRR